MSTRPVRLDEDVYEYVKSKKRDDETFSETIKRLIAPTSLLDLVGILSDEEAEAFREAIDEVDEDAKADVDELLERIGDRE